MHRKIPTDENLQARGCMIVSVCIMCMSLAESSDHLFLQCPFAMALWQWLGSKLHYVVDTTSLHTLLSCIHIRCSSQIADMFVAAIVHTLHSIWMARNTLWFSSNKANVHDAKVKIDYSVTRVVLCPTTIVFHLILCFLILFWWLGMIGDNASCKCIFRDHLGTYLGSLACNLCNFSVFNSEILGYICAMEYIWP